MDLFMGAMCDFSAKSPIALSSIQLERMTAYFVLLEEASHAFNLIAKVDPAETASRHFMDSLAPPALALLGDGASVIDVGSGAGFPGLPLAIAREDLQLTLLDSNNKKARFLESVVLNLGLKNVLVVAARAEDYSRSARREAFDAALSRALAPMNVLLEYMLPFVRPGGRALAWKGPAAAEEVGVSKRALVLLGAGEVKLHPYSIAGRESFMIVEIKKNGRTPSGYPRKAGMPSKSPI
jgi:16S rRNA (guanine527-N7)-methyltransferase